MFVAIYVDIDNIITSGKSGLAPERRKIKSYEYIHDHKIHTGRFAKMSDGEYYKIIEILEAKKFDGYNHPVTGEYIDFIIICEKVRNNNGRDYHSY